MDLPHMSVLMSGGDIVIQNAAAAGSGPRDFRNAVLTLTGGSLTAPRVFQTGNFGAYVFDDLRAGETYTLRIGAKRYRFQQLSWEITPQGNVTNLDFMANPQD
jgi:hypothetical protein